MTSKAPEVRIAQLGITRNTMPALVDRLFEILRQDATPAELDNLSALIAQRVARHRAELCSNGMTNHPPCRSLAQAMHDIRMKAERN